MHASTFSGNALTMAAGLAAMQNYDQDDANRINLLGTKLRDGFNQVFSQAGIRAQATGDGSLTNIHFTDQKINDARDTVTGLVEAGHIPGLLHLCMLRHGIMSASRLMYCVSTAMGLAEIDQAVTALEASVHELMPYIEQERSNLISA